MDPNVVFDTILDESENTDRRIEAIDDLIAWIEAGGFLPRTHGKIETPTFGGNTAARWWFRAHLRDRRTILTGSALR